MEEVSSLCSPFTHFLITRYNVYLESWGIDVSGQTTLDDDWMEHRFMLFSRYCFPSVISQTNKQFTWLIYMEESTSLRHLEGIYKLTAGHPFIQVHLVSGYHGCMQHIRDLMEASAGDYLLTSRLDNDDAISMTYIEDVEKQFVPGDRILINLLNGYSYNPAAKIATRLKHIERNSFCSFIEKRQSSASLISVRGFQHGQPPDGTQIINVNTPAGWLKIFHDRNVLSLPFGFPVFNHAFRRLFIIDPIYMQTSLTNTLWYTCRWLLDGISRKVFRRSITFNKRKE